MRLTNQVKQISLSEALFAFCTLSLYQLLAASRAHPRQKSLLSLLYICPSDVDLHNPPD
jgi:hypothetical protein